MVDISSSSKLNISDIKQQVLNKDYDVIKKYVEENKYLSGTSFRQAILILYDKITIDENDLEFIKFLFAHRSFYDINQIETSFILYLYNNFDHLQPAENISRLNFICDILIAYNFSRNLKRWNQVDLMIAYASNRCDKVILVNDKEFEMSKKRLYKPNLPLQELKDKVEQFEKVIEDQQDSSVFNESEMLAIRIRALLELIVNAKISNEYDQYIFYLNELFINIEVLDIYFALVAINSLRKKVKEEKKINCLMHELVSNVERSIKLFHSKGLEYALPSGWSGHFVLVSFISKSDENDIIYLRVDNAGEGCEHHPTKSMSDKQHVYPYLASIEKTSIKSCLLHFFNIYHDEDEGVIDKFYEITLKNKIDSIDNIKNFGYTSDTEQEGNSCVFRNLTIGFKNRTLKANKQHLYSTILDKELEIINKIHDISKEVDSYRKELYQDSNEWLISERWIKRKLKPYYEQVKFSLISSFFGSKPISVDTYLLQLDIHYKEYVEVLNSNQFFELFYAIFEPSKCCNKLSNHFSTNNQNYNDIIPNEDNYDNSSIIEFVDDARCRFCINDSSPKLVPKAKAKLKKELKISLIGQAGSGKSQFVKYLVNSQCKNEHLSKVFYCVILIPLRYITDDHLKLYSSDSTFSIEEADTKIISHFLFELNDFEKFLFINLFKSKKKKVLWIFDGYDEISNDLLTEYKQEIITLLNSNKPHSICTSRPYKLPTSHYENNLTISIRGFDQHTTRAYVEDFLLSNFTHEELENLKNPVDDQCDMKTDQIEDEIEVNNQTNVHIVIENNQTSLINNQTTATCLNKDEINELLSLINKEFIQISNTQTQRRQKIPLLDFMIDIINNFNDDNQKIKSKFKLTTIPLYLELICTLWKYNGTNLMRSIVQDKKITINELVDMIVILKKQTCLIKENGGPLASLKHFLINRQRVMRRYLKENDCLERIAYDMFRKRQMQNAVAYSELVSLIGDVESDELLLGDIIELGFLKNMEGFTENSKQNSIFYFIHKLFMEYFIALYLIKPENKEEFISFLKEKAWNELNVLYYISCLLKNNKVQNQMSFAFDIINDVAMVKGECFHHFIASYLQGYDSHFVDSLISADSEHLLFKDMFLFIRPSHIVSNYMKWEFVFSFLIQCPFFFSITINKNDLFKEFLLSNCLELNNKQQTDIVKLMRFANKIKLIMEKKLKSASFRKKFFTKLLSYHSDEDYVMRFLSFLILKNYIKDASMFNRIFKHFFNQIPTSKSKMMFDTIIKDLAHFNIEFYFNSCEGSLIKCNFFDKLFETLKVEVTNEIQTTVLIEAMKMKIDEFNYENIDKDISKQIVFALGIYFNNLTLIRSSNEKILYCSDNFTHSYTSSRDKIDNLLNWTKRLISLAKSALVASFNQFVKENLANFYLILFNFFKVLE